MRILRKKRNTARARKVLRLTAGIRYPAAGILLLAALTSCAALKAPVSGAVFSEGSGRTVISREYENVIPEYVFTYADNQPDDYPTTRAAYYFARLVNERSEGRMQICVFTGAALGAEEVVSGQLRYGGVDFMRASLAQVAKYSTKAQVLILPYLYRNSEHMWKVLDGEIGEEIMDSFEGSGLKPLSWYDAGVRDFYMKEPVYTLEDIRGKRIRVQESEVMKDMAAALGAVPVPTEYSEVYSAIQTGMVDGAENNWPSYESMGHNEVAGYFINDEHMRLPELQLISRSTFDKLSEEDRNMIVSCARESAVYERQLWAEFEQTARERALASGTIEINLPPEEIQRFSEAVQPLYEEYGKGLDGLIERIRAVE